ncbi:transporter substrate-binding domain-containing protein [Paenibacillus sp. UNC499MF]|uniref:transporter substrate-binding domain-containing protein n=1 Tax=Paenibacillus sp. UNC499MF TaxID=1502751 RepID=UPI00089F9288|nr:transporter substrate-binding domain-containing protein [Paenibacillus sp. UNC499MF]SEG69069.1 L-cystine transport system substrate-binding protein [Paenibacillus sp. UNC499MF]
MKKQVNKWLAGAGILVLAAVSAGCGKAVETGGGATPAAAEKPGESPAGQAKKVIVGTGTKFPQVCFIDQNGKLTGFDVELIKELDKRIPEYEFEFKTMEFQSLLLSLETNKIDLIAHQMEKNPEREQKYLFNKEPYSIFLNKVAVEINNDTIKTIDDLKGKKVRTGATSNEAYILQEYNKKNNNAIEIVYDNATANDLVDKIRKGRIDATVTSDFALRNYTDKDGKVALKTVGEPLTESDVLYVFRKTDGKLADRIDQAIKEVKADGTLSKLSVQWLGQDFSHVGTQKK